MVPTLTKILESKVISYWIGRIVLGRSDLQMRTQSRFVSSVVAKLERDTFGPQ